MRYLAAISLLALATLGGCGQTGPLYLPGQEPAHSSSDTASEEPAAESDTQADAT